MKRILFGLLGFILVVSLTSCFYTEEKSSISYSSSITSVITSDSEPISSEIIVTPSDDIEVYADDEVVNQFIIQYNKITQSTFSDIHKGNIRTKYYAYSYGYSCELLHAANTNKICVTIDSNKSKNKDVPGMRDVFHDVVKAIDPSLSDEDIFNHFDDLVQNGYLKENDELGSVIILFSPDSDHWRGHIEIAAH